MVSERREPSNGGYIPALRLHALTKLYDPLIERWMAMGRLRAAVIEALDLHPGLRLLELGSGPGRLAIEIAHRYPDVVIDAVDADPAMVEQAKRNAGAASVSINFQQADITQLPELGRYDRICSTLVFHHLKPAGKQAALQTTRQLLYPQGRLVIADFGRPRGRLQWLLASIIHPLDGIENTLPHRDGRFEALLHTTFSTAQSLAVWETLVGTIELFVCTP